MAGVVNASNPQTGDTSEDTFGINTEFEKEFEIDTADLYDGFKRDKDNNEGKIIAIYDTIDKSIERTNELEMSEFDKVLSKYRPLVIAAAAADAGDKRLKNLIKIDTSKDIRKRKEQIAQAKIRILMVKSEKEMQAKNQMDQFWSHARLCIKNVIIVGTIVVSIYAIHVSAASMINWYFFSSTSPFSVLMRFTIDNSFCGRMFAMYKNMYGEGRLINWLAHIARNSEVGEIGTLLKDIILDDLPMDTFAEFEQFVAAGNGGVFPDASTAVDFEKIINILTSSNSEQSKKYLSLISNGALKRLCEKKVPIFNPGTILSFLPGILERAGLANITQAIEFQKEIDEYLKNENGLVTWNMLEALSIPNTAEPFDSQPALLGLRKHIYRVGGIFSGESVNEAVGDILPLLRPAELTGVFQDILTGNAANVVTTWGPKLNKTFQGFKQYQPVIGKAMLGYSLYSKKDFIEFLSSSAASGLIPRISCTIYFSESVLPFVSDLASYSVFEIPITILSSKLGWMSGSSQADNAATNINDSVFSQLANWQLSEETKNDIRQSIKKILAEQLVNSAQTILEKSFLAGLRSLTKSLSQGYITYERPNDDDDDDDGDDARVQTAKEIEQNIARRVKWRKLGIINTDYVANIDPPSILEIKINDLSTIGKSFTLPTMLLGSGVVSMSAIMYRSSKLGLMTQVSYVLEKIDEIPEDFRKTISHVILNVTVYISGAITTYYLTKNASKAAELASFISRLSDKNGRDMEVYKLTKKIWLEVQEYLDYALRLISCFSDKDPNDISSSLKTFFVDFGAAPLACMLLATSNPQWAIPMTVSAGASSLIGLVSFLKLRENSLIIRVNNYITQFVFDFAIKPLLDGQIVNATVDYYDGSIEQNLLYLRGMIAKCPSDLKLGKKWIRELIEQEFSPIAQDETAARRLPVFFKGTDSDVVRTQNKNVLGAVIQESGDCIMQNWPWTNWLLSKTRGKMCPSDAKVKQFIIIDSKSNYIRYMPKEEIMKGLNAQFHAKTENDWKKALDYLLHNFKKGRDGSWSERDFALYVQDMIAKNGINPKVEHSDEVHLVYSILREWVLDDSNRETLKKMMIEPTTRVDEADIKGLHKLVQEEELKNMVQIGREANNLEDSVMVHEFYDQLSIDRWIIRDFLVTPIGITKQTYLYANVMPKTFKEMHDDKDEAVDENLKRFVMNNIVDADSGEAGFTEAEAKDILAKYAPENDRAFEEYKRELEKNNGRQRDHDARKQNEPNPNLGPSSSLLKSLKANKDAMSEILKLYFRDKGRETVYDNLKLSAVNSQKRWINYLKTIPEIKLQRKLFELANYTDVSYKEIETRENIMGAIETLEYKLNSKELASDKEKEIDDLLSELYSINYHSSDTTIYSSVANSIVQTLRIKGLTWDNGESKLTDPNSYLWKKARGIKDVVKKAVVKPKIDARLVVEIPGSNEPWGVYMNENGPVAIGFIPGAGSLSERHPAYTISSERDVSSYAEWALGGYKDIISDFFALGERSEYGIDETDMAIVQFTALLVIHERGEFKEQIDLFLDELKSNESTHKTAARAQYDAFFDGSIDYKNFLDIEHDILDARIASDDYRVEGASLDSLSESGWNGVIDREGYSIIMKIIQNYSSLEKELPIFVRAEMISWIKKFDGSDASSESDMINFMNAYNELYSDKEKVKKLQFGIIEEDHLYRAAQRRWLEEKTAEKNLKGIEYWKSRLLYDRTGYKGKSAMINSRDQIGDKTFHTLSRIRSAFVHLERIFAIDKKHANFCSFMKQEGMDNVDDVNGGRLQTTYGDSNWPMQMIGLLNKLKDDKLVSEIVYTEYKGELDKLIPLFYTYQKICDRDGGKAYNGMFGKMSGFAFDKALEGLPGVIRGLKEMADKMINIYNHHYTVEVGYDMLRWQNEIKNRYKENKEKLIKQLKKNAEHIKKKEQAEARRFRGAPNSRKQLPHRRQPKTQKARAARIYGRNAAALKPSSQEVAASQGQDSSSLGQERVTAVDETMEERLDQQIETDTAQAQDQDLSLKFSAPPPDEASSRPSQWFFDLCESWIESDGVSNLDEGNTLEDIEEPGATFTSGFCRPPTGQEEQMDLHIKPQTDGLAPCIAQGKLFTYFNSFHVNAITFIQYIVITPLTAANFLLMHMWPLPPTNPVIPPYTIPWYAYETLLGPIKIFNRAMCSLRQRAAELWADCGFKKTDGLLLAPRIGGYIPHTDADCEIFNDDQIFVALQNDQTNTRKMASHIFQAANDIGYRWWHQAMLSRAIAISKRSAVRMRKNQSPIAPGDLFWYVATHTWLVNVKPKHDLVTDLDNVLRVAYSDVEQSYKANNDDYNFKQDIQLLFAVYFQKNIGDADLIAAEAQGAPFSDAYMQTLLAYTNHAGMYHIGEINTNERMLRAFGEMRASQSSNQSVTSDSLDMFITDTDLQKKVEDLYNSVSEDEYNRQRRDLVEIIGLFIEDLNSIGVEDIAHCIQNKTDSQWPLKFDRFRETDQYKNYKLNLSSDDNYYRPDIKSMIMDCHSSEYFILNSDHITDTSTENAPSPETARGMDDEVLHDYEQLSAEILDFNFLDLIKPILNALGLPDDTISMITSTRESTRHMEPNERTKLLRLCRRLEVGGIINVYDDDTSIRQIADALHLDMTSGPDIETIKTEIELRLRDLENEVMALFPEIIEENCDSESTSTTSCAAIPLNEAIDRLRPLPPPVKRAVSKGFFTGADKVIKGVGRVIVDVSSYLVPYAQAELYRYSPHEIGRNPQGRVLLSKFYGHRNSQTWNMLTDAIKYLKGLLAEVGMSDYLHVPDMPTSYGYKGGSHPLEHLLDRVDDGMKEFKRKFDRIIRLIVINPEWAGIHDENNENGLYRNLVGAKRSGDSLVSRLYRGKRFRTCRSDARPERDEDLFESMREMQNVGLRIPRPPPQKFRVDEIIFEQENYENKNFINNKGKPYDRGQNKVVSKVIQGKKLEIIKDT